MKIHLSDWISATALLVSIGSLWISWEAGRPRIQVSEVGAYSGRVFDPRTNQTRMLAIHPVLITNSGGRTATLIGFRERQGLPVVIAVYRDMPSTAPTLVEMFLSEKTAAEIDSSVLENRETISVERLALLNQQFEAGESGMLTIAFLADPYDAFGERTADHLLLTLEAVFSDGSVVPVTSAFQVPARRESGATRSF